MVTVLRTWKRDGSWNAMPLAAAAANLRQHGLRPEVAAADGLVGVRGWQVRTIARRLARGQKLETRWAVFRLAR